MEYCVRLWQVRREKLIGSGLAVYVREMRHVPNVGKFRAAGMVRAVETGQLDDDEKVVYAVDVIPQHSPSDSSDADSPTASVSALAGQSQILQRYLANASTELARLLQQARLATSEDASSEANAND